MSGLSPRPCRAPVSQGDVSLHADGMTIFGPNHYSLNFLYQEIFVDRVYDVELGAAHPVIFDCGANVGMSTLYFKARHPGAVIHAFEPESDSYKYLQANVAHNAIEDVSTYKHALGYPARQDYLYSSEWPASAQASLDPKRLNWSRKATVEVALLSRYLQQQSRVDLVKLDVEGSEREILSDLRKSDALDLPRHYIVEYHHNIRPRQAFGPFLEAFERAGYASSVSARRVRPGEFQDVLIYLTRRLM